MPDEEYDLPLRFGILDAWQFAPNLGESRLQGLCVGGRRLRVVDHNSKPVGAGITKHWLGSRVIAHPAALRSPLSSVANALASPSPATHLTSATPGVDLSRRTRRVRCSSSACGASAAGARPPESSPVRVGLVPPLLCLRELPLGHCQFLLLPSQLGCL